ncbi:MAG: sugar phosphate isomerase/epimerase [Candidatus Cohnella colombiensis]|uniref:Sugar phosphate isomerase/epimerase n=1 Tax=Candidatus Cohnella colombiensis TaxID=3121368 RepID=A0AA95JC46_9BACL|nr:MAG: sugar phosphate isomerase/epimerase [Cohnella sp.]
MIRLGGPIYIANPDPDQWINALKQEGYTAAVCPVDSDADTSLIDAFRAAAEQNDILIAEVGAWSNPISPDDAERLQALDKCKRQLYLADRIGARCCVNIAGSRNRDQWDGPHPDNYSEDTFALVVDTVRNIIDEVKPENACFALEAMPWMIPDSADSYLELVRAIDRKKFAVHFDPVNIINHPRQYYRNGAMIRDFIAKLGSAIVTCHAKDIRLNTKLTVHLEEVVPGNGELAYGVLLRELHNLGREIPLILEHLSSEEEYRTAAKYIRSVAAREQIELRA